MFDTEHDHVENTNKPGRWRLPKTSPVQWLTTALFLSLFFSGYLIARSDVRAVAFPPAEKQQVISPEFSGSQLVSQATQTSASAATPSLGAQDINTMLGQVQEMQRMLQTTSGQLDQKYQTARPSSGVNAAQMPVPRDNIPALMAEIEALNQTMQPLMVQLETATATQSSRPASELAAIRTQVNTIHQRLTYLMAQVEAAKAGASQTNGATPGSSNGQWISHSRLPSNGNNTNQAAYTELYQTMSELKNVLQQLQSQVNNP